MKKRKIIENETSSLGNDYDKNESNDNGDDGHLTIYLSIVWGSTFTAYLVVLRNRP